MLSPNQKDPLLRQLAVRKAISMAIDRNALCKLAEYGYEPPASKTGLILPYQKQWLDPKLPKQDIFETFDPKGAIKVLEDAGFKRGSDGIFVSPDGKKLHFTLNVISGYTDWEEQCTMIQQYLKNIGIQVDVHILQYGNWYDQLISGKYQLAITGSGSGPNPYYFYYNLLWPKSPMNYENWSNPKSTHYLNQFQYTTDPNVQKKAIFSLERVVAEQLPAIPLVYGVNWYEFRTANYVGWPDANHPYVDPSPWGVSTEIVLMHLKPTH